MSRTPMRNFSERNPVVIAVVGIVVLVALVVGIFNARNLPVVGDGATYAADFTEAAGLRTGDDVNVAGVRVGSVSGVDLQGAHVRVEFRVKDAWLGDQSQAAIKIKTVLGAKYLSIDPLGSAQLQPGDTIPVARTHSPFDITDAFSQLTTTIDDVDTDQLGASFTALAQAFANTPDTVKSTLTGLTRLSQTISSRDSELTALLQSTQQVTATISDSNDQISSLITSGDQLLTELQARDTAIRQLLAGIVSLSQQVQGLVADNQDTLGPALAQINQVAGVLDDNQANLQKALSLLGPYYSLVNDALGNGHWFDTYICGLFDASDDPILNPNQGAVSTNSDGTAVHTPPRNCQPQAGG